MEDDKQIDMAELEGLYVTSIKVASYLKPHPDDERQPKQERPLTELSRTAMRVYGVDAAKQLTIRRTSRRLTTPHDYGYASVHHKYRIGSRVPFVAVGFSDDTDDSWFGEWGPVRRRLYTPRLVKYGEFGQSAPIEKPQVRLSTMFDPTMPVNRPRTLNWVNLYELSKMTGLKPTTILREFAGFSLSTYYEPNVVVTYGALRQMWRVYTRELPESYCSGETRWGGEDAGLLIDEPFVGQALDSQPEQYFVTQTFAYTVLRLVKYGYKLGCDMPEGGVLVRAPKPVAPAVSLPVLSVEGLRGLTRS